MLTTTSIDGGELALAMGLVLLRASVLNSKAWMPAARRAVEQ
jgi:hypothetical protein